MNDVSFTPRMYQINARDQIIESLESQQKRVFLVLLPTGMGKTFISTMTLELMFERGILGNDEKVLFLVQDRKLKHQLYEMAKSYGLTRYGYLYLLDAPKTLPSKMARKHAELARFIFATPILLMNALTSKTKRIGAETLGKVRVVVIDEILDVFAQSYGKMRPRSETIEYVERRFGNGRTFKEIVHDLKAELESSGPPDYQVDESRLEDLVIREFAYQNYRLNKTFEPILQFLDLLDSQSKKIIIGLTASLSQDMKIALLKKTFGGIDHVTEIRPFGDDFEHFRPAYQLRRIRVFDEWITKIDALISAIKGNQMKNLNLAYEIITGNPKIPFDRILLFITDILGKKHLQEKLLQHFEGADHQVTYILASARAYLLLTVARQHLLEGTFTSFRAFIEKITNKALIANKDFEEIRNNVTERNANVVPDQKEERLLYWLDKFVAQGKRILIFCRFVEMTKHLANLATRKGIPSINVHGGLSGASQYDRIKSFKSGKVAALFASERLIEKGTDLPEADIGIYYGTTLSLTRYEQSLGRIRSNVQNIKTLYTISYDQTIEAEKSLKRDTMFLELIGKKLTKIGPNEESFLL